MARAASSSLRRAPINDTSQPQLKTVPVKRLSFSARRRRLRALAALGGLGLLAALFGVVIAQVVLTQGQFELAKLNRETQTEQERYSKLRLQVAELESPERITSEATNKLGMVAPATVTYLRPVGIRALVNNAAVRVPSNDGHAWATVKRQLANDKQ